MGNIEMIRLIQDLSDDEIKRLLDNPPPAPYYMSEVKLEWERRQVEIMRTYLRRL